jgi:hypothetical protein
MCQHLRGVNVDFRQFLDWNLDGSIICAFSYKRNSIYDIKRTTWDKRKNIFNPNLYYAKPVHTDVLLI